MKESPDFYSLSELAKKEGSTEHELIRSAANGTINLYVWFEGLLLKTCSPAKTYCKVSGIDCGVMLLKTEEMHEYSSKGRRVESIGKMLFGVHEMHNGWMQIPHDEIPQFMARGEAKISCLVKEGTLYRCHEMEISEFRNLRRDHDKMRKICEGITHIPEYTIDNLFLHIDDVHDIQMANTLEKKKRLELLNPSKDKQDHTAPADDNFLREGLDEILKRFCLLFDNPKTRSRGWLDKWMIEAEVEYNKPILDKRKKTALSDSQILKIYNAYMASREGSK